jgi:hypothetical protein
VDETVTQSYVLVIYKVSNATIIFLQLVLSNWVNFQLQVLVATKNQLHKTIAKCYFSSSVKDLSYTHFKLSMNRRTLSHTFFQTSKLKISTTRKTLSKHFHLETIKFLKNFKNKFFTLEKMITIWRNLFQKRVFFHTWKTYNTLKKSLPHLPLTWKDSYSLCNLTNCREFKLN